jgi:hypothetical protein
MEGKWRGKGEVEVEGGRKEEKGGRKEGLDRGRGGGVVE